MIIILNYLTKLCERQNKYRINVFDKSICFFFGQTLEGGGAGKGKEYEREREREEEERGRACSSAVLLHAHAALEMAAMACLAPGNGRS
jgi:hypothetical protein